MSNFGQNASFAAGAGQSRGASPRIPPLNANKYPPCPLYTPPTSVSEKNVFLPHPLPPFSRASDLEKGEGVT